MGDSDSDSVKSPIIMKVDGPDDEATDETLSSTQVCSPSSRSTAFSTRNFLNRPVLRPSLFSQQQGSKSFSLTPSKLASNLATIDGSSQNGTSKPFLLTPSKLGQAGNHTETVEEHKSAQNGDTPAVKFVPLADKSADLPAPKTEAPQPTTTAQHSFVFGQNLQDRVVGDKVEDSKPSTSISTNGASEMLFSTAAKEIPVQEVAQSTKSLTESARELEEQRSNKRKYEEVEVFTGEEDETNVLHISSKLFTFDKAVGNWQERGRGTLRLNDLISEKKEEEEHRQSRLVFRTAGVLKVVLNTKIWHEMTAERASAKSIRFTGLDNSGEIKVYLIMASPEDITQLHSCLKERIQTAQKHANQKKPNTTSDPDSIPVEEKEDKEENADVSQS